MEHGLERPETAADPSAAGDGGVPAGLLAAGGLLGGVAAMSCCILPLGLFSVGVSGAWIGTLTSLAPYQPLIVAITLAALGAGFWLVYRRPATACAEGAACARPLPRRAVKTALWASTAMVAAAFGFNLIAPILLGA